MLFSCALAADPPHHIDPALVEEDRRAREAAGGWQTQPQQPYAPASQAASARATQPPAGAAKPGSGAGVGAYPSASVRRRALFRFTSMVS